MSKKSYFIATVFKSYFQIWGLSFEKIIVEVDNVLRGANRLMGSKLCHINKLLEPLYTLKLYKNLCQSLSIKLEKMYDVL